MEPAMTPMPMKGIRTPKQNVRRIKGRNSRSNVGWNVVIINAKIGARQGSRK